jgi:signal peptidase I
LKKNLLVLRIVVVVLVIGAAGFLTLRFYLTRLIVVPTGAMLNTIVPGDHLVAYKLFHDPSRGDIVVYQQTKESERYVSRIVGLPGETIQLRGSSVFINGRILDEQRVTVESKEAAYDPLKEISSEGNGPYRVFYSKHLFEEQDRTEAADEEFGTTTPFQIPDNSYFLLGDNRDNSYDSRYRGPVPRELIWGKASIIYFSIKMPLQDEVRWERMFTKVR